MTDEATAELPGRREAGAIADWAAHRRAAGEFGDPAAPRSVADGAVVELREVTAANVREVCALQVTPPQRRNVAPNAVSLAEAAVHPEAWPRAIYADDVAVGFAMLSIDTAKPEYYLWRFMLDERFQGRGYGRAAIDRIVEHVRGLPGAKELLVSWVPGPGGPADFYLGLGFTLTGEEEHGEVEGRLAL